MAKCEVSVFLGAALITSLACDYQKDKPAPSPTTTVRCEQVASPPQEIPEDRKKRMDEIADLNSYIDLEIARHDKNSIDSTKQVIEALREVMQKSKGTSKGRDAKNFLDAANSLDEVIDTAAKHRHH